MDIFPLLIFFNFDHFMKNIESRDRTFKNEFIKLKILENKKAWFRGPKAIKQLLQPRT